MQSTTSDSSVQLTGTALMSRFVVLLIVCVALAALVALALTLGHFVTPHLFSSLMAHPTRAIHPDSGCPAIIILC